jgi:uncharacterized protein
MAEYPLGRMEAGADPPQRGEAGMVIGLCTIDIEVAEGFSLKDKRRVVRSIVTRVRNEFNVSIAEVDNQDSWNLATLAVVCVSNDRRYADGLLQRVVGYIERERLDCVLLDYQIEFL